MLTRIQVSNYQSLISADVELGRVTVILGPNDHGKSALVRALNACAQAQSGTAFITYGMSQSSVTLHVEGRVVSWEKGEKVNSYSLDGQKFEKIGRSVPDEVEELLALSPVSFDKDLELSLNFAEQDDPHFLIPTPGGLSPSSVAKVLGDLTNLNVLFKAVQEANRRKRAAIDLRTLRTQDLKSLEERLVPYKTWAEEQSRQASLESGLDRVHLLNEQLAQHRALAQKKSSLRDQFTQLEKESKQIPRLDLELLNAAKKRADLKATLELVRDNYSQITSALAELDSQDDLADRSLLAHEEERKQIARETLKCETCGQSLPQLTNSN